MSPSPNPPPSSNPKDLLDQARQLAGILNNTNYRFIKLLGHMSKRNTHAHFSYSSMVNLLDHQCGLSPCAARERLRVARALDNLPAIDEAFRQNVLSYSKVRAITRVATPRTEGCLVRMARTSSAADLERLVRTYRRTLPERPQHEPSQHEQRSVAWYHDEDGMLILTARLPTEMGAVLVEALQKASDEDVLEIDAFYGELLRGRPANEALEHVRSATSHHESDDGDSAGEVPAPDDAPWEHALETTVPGADVDAAADRAKSAVTPGDEACPVTPLSDGARPVSDGAQAGHGRAEPVADEARPVFDSAPRRSDDAPRVSAEASRAGGAAQGAEGTLHADSVSGISGSATHGSDGVAVTVADVADGPGEDSSARVQEILDIFQRSRRTHEQRRADALMDVVEAFLAAPPATASRLPNHDKYHVTLHIDRNELGERSAEGVEPRYYVDSDEGGVGIDTETGRQLACDASLREFRQDKSGRILHYGRRERIVPAGLQRALRLRDKGCRFPGCHHTRFLDAHHIRHWIDGGETSEENLILLCNRHHGYLHQLRFSVSFDASGGVVFKDRHGACIAASVDPQLPSCEAAPASVPSALALAGRQSPFDKRSDRELVALLRHREAWASQSPDRRWQRFLRRHGLEDPQRSFADDRLT